VGAVIKMTNTFRAFASFTEASAFAKSAAHETQCSVSVFQQGDKWLVEYLPSPQEMDTSSIATHLSSKQASMDVRVAKPHEKSALENPLLIKYCIGCGRCIPPARVELNPNVARCTKCQSEFEQTHDTRQKIDEGLAGTRDAHKKMRGQLWGDMRNRGRGK
jgi:RNA polymerase-binding transcription factor DksA